MVLKYCSPSYYLRRYEAQPYRQDRTLANFMLPTAPCVPCGSASTCLGHVLFFDVRSHTLDMLGLEVTIV